MLFKEENTVYCEKRTKHINTQHAQNTDFF